MLLRNAVDVMLTVNGYEVHWFESIAELSAKVDGLALPGVVLALANNQSVRDYCVSHNLKMLALSERPRDKAALSVDRVYTDPLLPSALLRALEREQRGLNSFISGA